MKSTDRARAKSAATVVMLVLPPGDTFFNQATGHYSTVQDFYLTHIGVYERAGLPPASCYHTRSFA